MNPADYGMLWMGSFAQDRMILDDNSMLSVGMSVMDDITHQTHSMDMNPMMGIVSDPTAATAPTTGPIEITLDTYAMASHHHYLDQQHPQAMLEYSLDGDVDTGGGGVGICIDDDGNSNSMQHYNDDDTHEYTTHFDSDPDNSVHSYMGQKSIATQTNKKIKPVKRPGLVLKTPIAYQPCLDPSVIPIQRDGMAVCERCGAIGVKHSFYTKERRFCSMACARNELEHLTLSNNGPDFSNTISNNTTKMERQDIELDLDSTQNPIYSFTMTPRQQDIHGGVLYKDILPQDDLPQIPKGNRLPSPCPQDEKILSVRRKPSEFINSYDWNTLLGRGKFFAADVTCFRHAPGYDMWTNIGVGMKVEVENTDCDNQGIQQGVTPHSFWVASVLKICGFKALIRYEGFDEDNSHDFWVNLCSSEVHPVGWCATRGKPLIPPRTIENKYSDWKTFLVKSLSGARTLPSTFYNKISDSFKSRFRVGLQLEVVDKNRISQVKLATVAKIVGKRLFVKYFDAPDDNGFWCHEDSPLIHPVGWASTVGHNLVAPTEYLERMIAGHDQMIEATENDSVLDLFKMNFSFEEYFLEGKTSAFQEGMKLEAIDPLNLSSICVATVMVVLKFGYMMIRIDSYDPTATGSDWFCYHEKSPCIFPPGFCNDNNIVLTPPRGYENGLFNWEQYLEDTNSQPADPYLFQREIPHTGFQVGMKLECADLMDPRLVCVATIARIVGRLLKIRFDGWEDEYDQWLDCESPDMYPVGWCLLVGHKLQGPPAWKVSPKTPAGRRKRRKKPKMESGKTLNPNIQTRNNTVKKDREIFDQQRHTNELKMITARGSGGGGMGGVRIKQETKFEITEDDEDEYDEDDYSQSAVSGQSTPLPHTPEPTRTPTPMQDRLHLQTRSHTPSGGSHKAATDAAISQDKKQTNHNTSNAAEKVIPRLTDVADIHVSKLAPDTWTKEEVSEFLRANDCNAYCDAFTQSKIDGRKMLNLTKDEIITMLSMKVGPSLKIFDLIQQLKCKINPQQSRIMKSNINKKFL